MYRQYFTHNASMIPSFETPPPFPIHVSQWEENRMTRLSPRSTWLHKGLRERGTLSKKKKLTSLPIFTPTPPNPGKRTISPTATVIGTRTPLVSRCPGPTAMTTASFIGVVAAEGRKRPLAVFYMSRKGGSVGRKERGDAESVPRLLWLVERVLDLIMGLKIWWI
jgi:hypothetical protein